MKYAVHLLFSTLATIATSLIYLDHATLPTRVCQMLAYAWFLWAWWRVLSSRFFRNPPKR